MSDRTAAYIMAGILVLCLASPWRRYSWVVYERKNQAEPRQKVRGDENMERHDSGGSGQTGNKDDQLGGETTGTREQDRDKGIFR